MSADIHAVIDGAEPHTLAPISAPSLGRGKAAQACAFSYLSAITRHRVVKKFSRTLTSVFSPVATQQILVFRPFDLTPFSPDAFHSSLIRPLEIP
jgi:hypothetical protein